MDLMADISMCRDSKCPSREGCYRYRAKPGEFRQSYAGYRHGAEGVCEGHLPIMVWSDDMLRPMGEIEKKLEGE